MEIENFYLQLAILVFSWPVAIVVVALIFKKPLADLMNQIKRLKIGNSEIERFDRAISKSEAVVDEMEHLQILLAEAALTEMRAIDDSPYAPENHKAAIKAKADNLQVHLNALRAKKRASNADP